MEDNIILKASNVSKQYRLGLVGTGTLSHDLNRLWHKIRGKEDPYLQVGAINDRKASQSSDYVWALKDINFEVKRGEILGIIGKNGAGKSTLLKILSRVTGPTQGSIKTKGRIASLLEVGTGMHPELTGRENIYLNGAILGMSKAEIASKIDEIVDFSGCKMYIDTPVKRYSSGMRVRLGFAVAAFLEPDILVVDEVLAVGDAEFQKKAIGKMQDISSTSGRTILFVSHDMTTVKKICSRTIVLENGCISFNGFTNDGIAFYLNKEENPQSFYERKQNTELNTIKEISIINQKDNLKSHFFYEESVFLKIVTNDINKEVALSVNVKDKDFNLLFTDEQFLSFKSSFKVEFPSKFLMKGIYYVDVHIYTPNIEFHDSIVELLSFEITTLPAKYSMYGNANSGLINSPLKWFSL